jgi:hypothetical protein
MTPRYAIPDGDAVLLAVQPRRTPWDAAGDPAKVRISAFLDAAEEAATQMNAPRLAGTPGPLALCLDIGLPPAAALLEHHDLDDYLFPVTGHLSRRTRRDFVSVWGTKAVADDSYVRVGAARPADGAALHRVRTTASGDSTAYRQQIRNQLATAEELPPGPVWLELVFTLNPRRPWINLWKPTIDSLGPLLGLRSLVDPWQPRDARIVRLGLHHVADPSLAHEAVIDVIASAAP